MKKLSLNKNSFAGAEVLSRAQLKKVMGGDGSGYVGSGGDGGGDGGGGDGGSGDSPKVAACKNKREGDSCSFLYNGNMSPGFCRSYAPNYIRHCSDLL